jgi:hypothetical protein
VHVLGDRAADLTAVTWFRDAKACTIVPGWLCLFEGIWQAILQGQFAPKARLAIDGHAAAVYDVMPQATCNFAVS